MILMPHLARRPLRLSLALLAFTALTPVSAYAACSTPSGNAGDTFFSSTSNVMVYCNGTNWIAMGSNNAVSYGTMTTGNICTASSTTGITCSTAAINLASQVTGILPAANMPGLTAANIWVGNAANVATAVTASGDCTISNTGAFSCTKTGGTAFGALATMSPTGTPSSSNFLRGDGTWATPAGSAGVGTITSSSAGQVAYYNATGTTVIGTSAIYVANGGVAINTTTISGALNINGTVNATTFAGAHSGSGASLTGIGVSALGGITGSASSSTYLRGDGTWATPAGGGSLSGGTTNYVPLWTSATSIGTANIYQNGSNVGFGTTSAGNTLTVNGTAGFQFGTNYTTAGTQSDVAINGASSMRYAGSGVATFNGITAGSNGQILYLHNASTSVLTLANQAAADTTVANQIVTGTGAALSVAANSAVTLQYDTTATNSSGSSGAWRVIGGSGSGGGSTPVGTTGQLQYNSGSNAMAASSNLTFISSSNALVVGTGAATPLATAGTIASPVHNVMPQATTYSISSSSGAVTLNTAATGQMAYYSNASTMSGTSNLYVSGTNIGIGTTSATYDLSFGGAAQREIWMERSASGAGNILKIQAGGGQLSTANMNGGTLLLSGGISTGTGTSQIQFQTAPSGSGSTDNTPATAMTIAGSGYVGIGTTIPGSLFEVWPSTSNLVTLGLGASPAITFRNGTGAWWHVGKDATSGGLQFSNGATVGATPDMTILSSGNVGIGTTTPLTTLDVRGPMYEATNFNGTLPTMTAFQSGYGGTMFGWNGLSTVPGESDFINVFRNGGNTAGGGFAFFNMSSATAVNTSPLMLISALGYVGIGTTVPQGMLHLYSSNTNGNHLALSSTGDTSNYWLFAKRASSYSTPNNLFYAYYNGSAWTEAIDITTSGNVGIGTPSPSVTGVDIYETGETDLKVSSSNSNAGIILNAAATTNFDYIRFARGGTGAFEMGKDTSGGNNGFYFNNNSASGATNAAMYIASGGNVGIGTGLPQTALQVNGTGGFMAGFTGMGTTYSNRGQTGGGVEIGYDRTNNIGNLVSVNENVAWTPMDYSAASHNFNINGSATSSLIVNSTGVGVGGISPSYTFDVNGVANFRSNIVLSTGSNTGSGLWSFGAAAWTGSTAASTNTNSVTGISYGGSGSTGSQLFTFSSAPGQVSVQLDGSLFIGDNPTYNPLGISGSTDGSLMVQGGGEFGGALYVNGTTYSTSVQATGLVLTSNTGSNWFGLEAEQGESPPHASLVNSGASRLLQFNVTSPYTAQFAGTVNDSDGAIHSSSDQRLKKDIVPLDGDVALATISKLNPVLYKWINPDLHGYVAESGGFIAQEMQKVMPHMIDENECKDADCALVNNGKAYTVGFKPEFFAYLVKAVQVLKADNDNLATQLKTAKAAHAADEKAIDELRAEIAEIHKLLPAKAPADMKGGK